ncbi:MAG: DUF5652 family protein [Nanoarchaeota archaeon]
MDIQSFAQNLASIPQWIIVLVAAWSIAWKGFAMWRASKNNSPYWFVALLIFNTMGILEILYLFLFSKINLNKSEVKRVRSSSRSKKK